MPWKVLILDPAADFLQGLGDKEYALMDAAIQLLAERGPRLGEPFVKLIQGSRHHNMKELRRRRGEQIFRVLFAFDTEQQAVLLVGGDKAKIGFTDFYEENIPIADALLDEHLSSLVKAEKPRKQTGKKGKTRGK